MLSFLSGFFGESSDGPDLHENPSYDSAELKNKLNQIKRKSVLIQRTHADDQFQGKCSAFNVIEDQEKDDKRDPFLLQDDEESMDDDDLFSTLSFSAETAIARNFDVDPTELYVLLQKRKWKSAIQRIKEAPQEVITWIYRYDQYEKTKLRWSLLPLHASIIMDAPFKVIEALVCISPETTRSKDDEGSLPLHLSCRLGSPVSVVRLLLKVYPKSAYLVDGSGSTPSQLLQESLHSNKLAAEDALKRYLSSGDGIQETSTADTKATSTADAQSSSTLDDDTIEEASNKHSVSSLRKGPQPKLSCDTGEEDHQHQCGSPIKVAFVKNEDACSADDSTLGTMETRKEKKTMKLEMDSPELKQIKDTHEAKIAEATEKLSMELQKARKDSDVKLQEDLLKLKGKHLNEMQQLQCQSNNNTSGPEEVWLTELLAKQQEEHRAIEQEALAAQEQAKQEVSDKFAAIFREMESQYRVKMAMATVKASTPRATPTDFLRSTPNAWESVISDSQRSHEAKRAEMTERYQAGMQTFQRHLVNARDAGNGEVGNDEQPDVVEEKQQHQEEFKKLDTMFKHSIEEIHQVINDIHGEMITAHVDTKHQAKGFGKMLRELDNKVRQKSDEAANSQKMQQTIDELQQRLEDNQKHSEALCRVVNNLEERLEEQNEREQIMEEKMMELQTSSMMMCFG